MFTQLSERLARTVKTLRGQARLTEDNITETVRDIRVALIEADVALPVIKSFIESVKQKATGVAVATSLNPGQAFLKIVNQELTQLMGATNETLNLRVQPPAVILVAGLQGAGKTTTVAKLAQWLKKSQKKSVLVASADVYRPAAIKQLATLAASVEAKFFPSDTKQDPVAIAQAAIREAKSQGIDVVIIDTAGRLAIDTDMMTEIKNVHAAIHPVETLFVVDSMTGQDAANTAKAFNETLPLTGVILTKIDGDARGGAALSIRQITGKPIKFLGVGEKTAALEPFHPDRLASRILGMGDVLSLIEKVEHDLDQDKAQQLAKKIQQGKRFNLQDFAEQLQQMQKMGNMSNLIDKIPGISGMREKVNQQLNQALPKKMLAMINSMTLQERRNPDLLQASRKRRIAAGSGTQVQDLNRMLKQFLQMQTMMKKFGKNPLALKSLLQGLGR